MAKKPSFKDFLKARKLIKSDPELKGRFDANRDGTLDPDELEKGAAALGREFKEKAAERNQAHLTVKGKNRKSSLYSNSRKKDWWTHPLFLWPLIPCVAAIGWLIVAKIIGWNSFFSFRLLGLGILAYIAAGIKTGLLMVSPPGAGVGMDEVFRKKQPYTFWGLALFYLMLALFCLIIPDPNKI